MKKFILLLMTFSYSTIETKNPDKFACYMESMGSQILTQMGGNMATGIQICGSTGAFSDIWGNIHNISNSYCGTNLPDTAVMQYLQMLSVGGFTAQVCESCPSISSGTASGAVSDWGSSFIGLMPKAYGSNGFNIIDVISQISKCSASGVFCSYLEFKPFYNTCSFSALLPSQITNGILSQYLYFMADSMMAANLGNVDSQQSDNFADIMQEAFAKNYSIINGNVFFILTVPLFLLSTCIGSGTCGALPFY